jgi:hypothetical protein
MGCDRYHQPALILLKQEVNKVDTTVVVVGSRNFQANAMTIMIKKAATIQEMNPCPPTKKDKVINKRQELKIQDVRDIMAEIMLLVSDIGVEVFAMTPTPIIPKHTTIIRIKNSLNPAYQASSMSFMFR